MDFQRLWHYQRFEPNLGDNLEVPEAQRLYLEVAVGLTKVELAAFARAMSDAHETPEHAATAALIADFMARSEEGFTDEVRLELTKQVEESAAIRDAAYVAKLAAAWSPFVRLGQGTHAINGKPLTCLADYLGFVYAQPGKFNLLELEREVGRFNSVTGTRALFSAPPAGSSTSTATRAAGKVGSQTGGR